MSDVQTTTIETNIPQRLDRLPWSKFHWLVIIGLGTVWILDGLEVTIVGSVASRLTESGSGIDIGAGQIGTAAAIYVAGACTGALFFGQLTDRLGRKRLFVLTLAIYIAATVATAFAFAPWYFFICRFFTGAGIGGEYAAINSAIDELIPARVRGRVDLIINGSYWLGSAAGSAAALLLLDTSIFAKDFGWRLAFGIGAILGLTIMLVRRHVPESPRWLFIHGREEEAERIVDGIEHDVEEETGQDLDEPDDTLTVRQREAIPFREIARVAFKLYPRRAVLGLALFIGQAFMYNALTFDLGTILGTFFGVASATVPVFIVIYAIGNFLGPVTLGRLFDTVGRKPMISGCYLGSAALTVVLAVLVAGDVLSKWSFLAFIVVIFFLASAGASAAYLTVSEVFPMETRALAIAFFYAVGTAIGGITGPLLFGHMIGSGDSGNLAIAFFIGAGAMALGGIAELLFGIKAEQANLEDIAQPLTVEDAEAEEGGDGAQDGDRAEEGEQPESAEVLRRRAEAERERAAAAQHRAAVHQLRAGSDNGHGWRAEALMAEMAELRAQRSDELAAATEARADGDTGAQERAAAAEHRAQGLSEREAALASDRSTDAERHLARADAAQERARADEQRAAAAEAEQRADQSSGPPADAQRARAEMHRRRADQHDALALAAEAHAERDGESAAADHERRAAALEERALAAEEEIEAAEHREAAAQAGGEAERDEDAGRRSAQRAERDARVRERLRRREERERSGTRRLRPGPGRGWHAPGMGGLVPGAEDNGEALDHEIEAIARAVDEHGATERRELAKLVGARFWGPGRFGKALREAEAEGRVRRSSRSTYGPPRRGETG